MFLVRVQVQEPMGRYTVKETVQTVNLAASASVGSIPTLPTILFMIPELGKFYYIDYTDKENPEGSFFGVARCVKEYKYNEAGEKLLKPMYEFEHQDKSGKMTLSLFYADEIIMEAT